jgi:hypothetical protein
MGEDRAAGGMPVSTLRFRNIDASPDDPVETWPFEGVLAAIERAPCLTGSGWSWRSTPIPGAGWRST